MKGWAEVCGGAPVVPDVGNLDIGFDGGYKFETDFGNMDGQEEAEPSRRRLSLLRNPTVCHNVFVQPVRFSVSSITYTEIASDFTCI